MTYTKEWLLLTNMRSRLVKEISAISTKKRVYWLLKMLTMKILGAQHGLYYAQAKILFFRDGRRYLESPPWFSTVQTYTPRSLTFTLVSIRV